MNKKLLLAVTTLGVLISSPVLADKPVGEKTKLSQYSLGSKQCDRQERIEAALTEPAADLDQGKTESGVAK